MIRFTSKFFITFKLLLSIVFNNNEIEVFISITKAHHHSPQVKLSGLSEPQSRQNYREMNLLIGNNVTNIGRMEERGHIY